MVISISITNDNVQYYVSSIKLFTYLWYLSGNRGLVVNPWAVALEHQQTFKNCR